MHLSHIAFVAVLLSACATNTPPGTDDASFSFTRTKADGARVEESVSYGMEGDALALVYDSELGERTLYVRVDEAASLLEMAMDDGRTLTVDFETEELVGEAPPQAVVDAFTLMVEEHGPAYGVYLEDSSADAAGAGEQLAVCRAAELSANPTGRLAVGALLCAGGVVVAASAAVSGVGLALTGLIAGGTLTNCALTVAIARNNISSQRDFDVSYPGAREYCASGAGTLSVTAASVYVFDSAGDWLTLTLTPSATPPASLGLLTLHGRIYDRDGTETGTWSSFPLVPEGARAGMPFEVSRSVPRIPVDGFAIVELSGEAFLPSRARLECRSDVCTVL